MDFFLGVVQEVRGSEKLGESGRLLCQHGLEQQDLFPSSLFLVKICNVHNIQAGYGNSQNRSAHI